MFQTEPTEDLGRLWDQGLLRLFLSHVSGHRYEVGVLKRELRELGVSAFVAHEDIEPSLEWQDEIIRALQSMHAMAALLTPDFHASAWTDQEVGFALGQEILIIPVRIPTSPYGFMANRQGMRGDIDAPAELASALIDILLRRRATSGAMREGLVVALEAASSFASSRAITTKVESTSAFTPEQLARIEAVIVNNNQVSASYGVPTRLRRVIDQGRVT